MDKKWGILDKGELVFLASALAILAVGWFSASKPSEHDLYAKVVMLTGAAGQCSGEQVTASSGINYILTAAHCKGIAINGSMHVITEDGKELERQIIAEDPYSDLLLLEGIPKVKGLAIADSLERFAHIRTFTHGKGNPTYKAEGTIIGLKEIQVILPDACNAMPKYVVVAGPFSEVCLLVVVETVTDAMIVPGSSGGMVVNDSGELVGVVSVGDGNFGGLVTLNHIKSFLGNY